jgi:hypothetical protein
MRETREQAIEAYRALLDYAEKLQKLEYTGADVLAAYYRSKLKDLENQA